VSHKFTYFTLFCLIIYAPTLNAKTELTMLKSELTAFFERDLFKLIEELELYTDENTIWALKEGINNSAGTLCLHLVGNLRHFIGAILGNTGYVRQRDLEFSRRNVPREQLIDDIRNVFEMVISTLGRLPDEALTEDYPLEKHGAKVTTMHMLIHLFGHLNYHLGQVNYHRRLISVV
jgi:uncharacterized damage-inducible protein DinB